ncbi:MAG: hypothetical protein ACI8TL_000908, partial [Natronomonas sp.]
ESLDDQHEFEHPKPFPAVLPGKDGPVPAVICQILVDLCRLAPLGTDLLPVLVVVVGGDLRDRLLYYPLLVGQIELHDVRVCGFLH